MWSPLVFNMAKHIKKQLKLVINQQHALFHGFFFTANSMEVFMALNDHGA